MISASEPPREPPREPQWSTVSLLKRKTSGLLELVVYTKETTSGDLYKNESKIEIAAKSALIFCAAPFYALGVLFCNLAKVVIHLTAPSSTQIIQDIWRIVRIPIFMTGMMLAALYGMVSPYDGRHLMGKIEFSWHDGAPCRMDWRHARSEDLFQLERDIQAIKKGKFHFLAYCMQKSGNINDQVEGSPRFVKA